MRIELAARDGEVAFDCDEDNEILLAGLAAGLGLPYECATGTCATCKASLENGDVNDGWADAPARRMLKTEPREILMCQARPKSDCRLAIRGRLGDSGGYVPSWRSGRLASITPLNHDVLQLEIEPDAPMPFDAGQFMLVDVPDVPGYRGWSMATFDPAGDRLVFTVKLMPGGTVSSWLSDGDRAGTGIRLFGPLGKASFRPDRDNADLLCIAGGSGLAPILAILDHALGSGHLKRHRADIFFGVRSYEDLYCVGRLLEIAAAAPERVGLTFAFSETMPGAAERAALPGVAIAEGFVHEIMGQAMAGRFENILAYMAGPPPMVEAAMRLLVMQGKVPPARIRYDKFS